MRQKLQSTTYTMLTIALRKKEEFEDIEHSKIGEITPYKTRKDLKTPLKKI